MKSCYQPKLPSAQVTSCPRSSSLQAIMFVSTHARINARKHGISIMNAHVHADTHINANKHQCMVTSKVRTRTCTLHTHTLLRTPMHTCPHAHAHSPAGMPACLLARHACAVSPSTLFDHQHYIIHHLEWFGPSCMCKLSMCNVVYSSRM